MQLLKKKKTVFPHIFLEAGQEETYIRNEKVLIMMYGAQGENEWRQCGCGASLMTMTGYSGSHCVQKDL